MQQPYLTKWLEIRSIEELESGDFLMQVDFVCDQTTAMVWKVDSFTGPRIRQVLTETEDTDMKFRLSFASERSSLDQQRYGQITRYGRNAVRKVKFACSETFAEQLAVLKRIGDAGELEGASFIAPSLDGSNSSRIEPDPKPDPKPAKSAVGAKKIASVGAALLVLILLFYFSFSKSSLMDEKALANTDGTALAEGVAAEDKSAQGERLTAQTERESWVKTAAAAAAIPAASEPPVPLKPQFQAPAAVSLDKPVNFGISKESVAITFDDGPSKYTKEIVDILERYNAGGTFFFVGTQVRKFPEAVKYASDHGFAIGNHSMTHANLQKLPAERQQAEILQTNKLIKDITSKPVALFRPPYGSMNGHTRKAAEGANMKIVLWNRDPEDWKSKNSPQHVLNYIEHAQAGGSVILLHESEKTVRLLPQLIKYLQKQQIPIVNLE